jgi:uncharacterized membrane protein YhaH (DUF805 family)
MEWYFLALENFANFKGRAQRRAYWMFFLCNFLVAVGIGFAAGVTGMKALALLSNIYALMTFLPSLAVGVRRMHDVNHSGWWMLAPFYNLVLLCRPGVVGENPYGPDPKAPKTPPTPLVGAPAPNKPEPVHSDAA